MTSLRKTLNATVQDVGRKHSEDFDDTGPSPPEDTVRWVGWFEWVWSHIAHHWIQDVPDALAFCEFECRSSECLTGEGCKNPQRPSD